MGGIRRTCRAGAVCIGLSAVTVVAGALLVGSAGDAAAKRRSYSPPQASMVVDGHTGETLHASNIDALRYPASLTKVMTLYLLFEQIEAGRLSMNSNLKVSAHAAARPPTKLGLKPGGTITVRDAVTALAVRSCNDVAAVIAENIGGSEAAFARMMTAKARAMGMTRTTFRNASGLPDPEQRTTARDLMVLAKRMLKDFPAYTEVFKSRYFKYRGRTYRNTNRLLFNYAGMEGMKTGFTRASGFNLITSARRGRKHLLAVVIGGRSAAHRNGTMARLLDGAWRQAVAHDPAQPAPSLMVAEALPEPNPSFHPGSTEVALRAAILKAAKAEDQPPRSVYALAASVIAGPPVHAAAAPETQTVEEGDTEAVAVADTGAGEDRPAPRTADPLGPYQVQVGSYLQREGAQSRLQSVAELVGDVVRGRQELTVSAMVSGKEHYRARFGGFTEVEARTACQALKGRTIDCLVVRAE